GQECGVGRRRGFERSVHRRVRRHEELAWVVPEDRVARGSEERNRDGGAGALHQNRPPTPIDAAFPDDGGGAVTHRTPPPTSAAPPARNATVEMSPARRASERSCTPVASHAFPLQCPEASLCFESDASPNAVPTPAPIAAATKATTAGARFAF